MALKIIVPGVDFSGFGNPKVQDYIEGFPADSLSALYLFNSGTVGSAYSGPATDYSGNGNAAALLSGSTAIKTTGGVGNVADASGAAGNGFGILSPVPISTKFTVFGASRNLFAASSSVSNSFLEPWGSSGNTAAPAAPVIGSTQFGNLNVGTDGVLTLNQITSGLGNNNPEIATYAATTAGAAWMSGGATRTAASASGAKDAYIAWAMAFDSVAGTVLFRALGQSVSLTGVGTPAALWASQQISRGAKHMFGAMNFNSNAAGVKGEIGVGGVYNGVAKAVADLDVVIASTKASMALKGITAV